MTVVTPTGSDAEIERETLAWLDDPYRHFGMSATRGR
jgi:hypothetical protein